MVHVPRYPSRLSIWSKVGAGVAALALAGVTSCGGGSKPEQAGTSSDAAEASASATVATPSGTAPVAPRLTREQQIAALVIPGNLSHQEIAAAYTERLAQWIMGGATPENYASWKATWGKPDGLDGGQLALKLARENTDIYALALIGNGYMLEPGARAAVIELERRNAEAIWLYFNTFDEEGQQPYSLTMTFDSIAEPVKRVGGTSWMTFKATEYDNRGANKTETLLASTPSDTNYNGQTDVIFIKFFTKGADGKVVSADTDIGVELDASEISITSS